MSFLPVVCRSGGFALLASMAVLGRAQYLSDPAYAIVHNDAKGFQAQKELDGYDHYGQFDGAADLLFTGNVGEWTFDFSGLSPATTLGEPGKFTLFVALDDHAAVDPSHYSISVEVDGKIELNKLLGGLAHGTERNGHFDTWVGIDVPLASFAGRHTLTITNTSMADKDDWIGVDRIQATFAPVPEPASFLVLGGAGALLLRRRRKSTGSVR